MGIAFLKAYMARTMGPTILCSNPLGLNLYGSILVVMNAKEFEKRNYWMIASTQKGFYSIEFTISFHMFQHNYI